MKSTTIDQLRQELASDEGCKYEIYLDHLNLPSFGIGHLIKKDDPEYGKPVGTVIEQERVDNVFKLDIAVTLEDCHRLYPDWNDLPEECQLIIANMMFANAFNSYRKSSYNTIAMRKSYLRIMKYYLYNKQHNKLAMT